MVVFKNKKNGFKYETKTTVHKVPSSGKYKVQGYIQVTYPNGKYETVSRSSLTFNLKKDADKIAAEMRKRLTTEAKQLAKWYICLREDLNLYTVPRWQME